MKTKRIYILIFIIIVFVIFKLNHVNKPIEYVEDLKNLSDPIQSDTTGEVNLKIDDWDVNITFIADYSISGRVVDVQDYYGFSFNDQLSPVDVGIAWGFLANDENLTWYSNGDRFLNWRGENTVINKLGGLERIGLHFSNNHLIPSNKNIKKLLKKIEENDYVKIEGYLVDIYATQPDGSYRYWNSSTSRSDTGDGACEVIYVENVVWLEEK